MSIIVTKENVDRQYFTTIRDHVCQISAPLAVQGICHFSHVRRWKDHTYSLFTTHPLFSVTFVKEEFHKYIFGGRSHEYQAGVVFIRDIEEHCIFIKKVCVEQSYYKPDFMITETCDDYTDFYWFGTPADFTGVYSFYANRIEMLYKYIDYFKSSGASFLKKVYQHRFTNEEEGADVTPLVSRKWQEKMGLHIANDADSQETRLMQMAKRLCFTPRELTCAVCLCQGMTLQEIAWELSLSVRTVEKFATGLKNKTRSRSLIHLITKLMRGCE